MKLPSISTMSKVAESIGSSGSKGDAIVPKSFGFSGGAFNQSSSQSANAGVIGALLGKPTISANTTNPVTLLNTMVKFLSRISNQLDQSLRNEQARLLRERESSLERKGTGGGVGGGPGGGGGGAAGKGGSMLGSIAGAVIGGEVGGEVALALAAAVAAALVVANRKKAQAYMDKKAAEAAEWAKHHTLTPNDSTSIYDRVKKGNIAVESVVTNALEGYKQVSTKGDAKLRENLVRQKAMKAGFNKDEVNQLLAQTNHESGGFKYKTELWSHNPSTAIYKIQQSYGGSKNTLGNLSIDDGFKFRGRGFIQITGRANYAHFGKVIGVDLIKNPDLAARDDIAADLAVAFYNERVKNKGISGTDVRGATRIINGKHMLGLDKRESLYRQYSHSQGGPVPTGAGPRSGKPQKTVYYSIGGIEVGVAPTPENQPRYTLGGALIHGAHAAVEGAKALGGIFTQGASANHESVGQFHNKDTYKDGKGNIHQRGMWNHRVTNANQTAPALEIAARWLEEHEGFKGNVREMIGHGAGISDVHNGAGHYEGRAMDVRRGAGGKIDFKRNDALARMGMAAGLTVLWNHHRYGSDGKITNLTNADGAHTDHMHWEVPATGYKGDITKLIGVRQPRPPMPPMHDVRAALIAKDNQTTINNNHNSRGGSKGPPPASVSNPAAQGAGSAPIRAHFGVGK